MNLITATRSQARKLAAGFGKHVASPVFLRGLQRPESAVDDLSVHMLVSSKTWHAGLLAACSWEFHTQRRWRIFIHDDGTVPAQAVESIHRQLPGIRFVPRAEADARVAEVFRDFPRCRAHRAQFNLFLKFADTLAFADRDRLMVLDSDVLFFKRPEEILAWVDSEARHCIYNEDTKEKFCLPRAEIQSRITVELLPRFNSGLVLMPRSAVRPALAEEFFETFEAEAHAPQFFEQTLYGLMASASPDGGRPLPRTYNISWDYWRAPGSVCRHYVGEFKHDLLYIEGANLLAARRLGFLR